MAKSTAPSRSPVRFPPEIAPLLEYLKDIGYGDVYVRRVPAGMAAPAGAVGPGADDRAARLTRLEGIGAEAAVCTRCRLAQGRKKVVFGAGDPGAELMLVGEAPGAEEDRQGLPFVGASGELLTRILAAMELTRDEVYIANVVKCRPPENRDPQPDEIAACASYLAAQIEIVAPKIVVALGRVAAQTLLACTTPLGRLRGRWHEVQGIPTYVTYHPSALLRDPELKRPTWDDMQQVRDRLRG
jgi:uracil-DNA glycosylase family 4